MCFIRACWLLIYMKCINNNNKQAMQYVGSYMSHPSRILQQSRSEKTSLPTLDLSLNCPQVHSIQLRDSSKWLCTNKRGLMRIADSQSVLGCELWSCECEVSEALGCVVDLRHTIILHTDFTTFTGLISNLNSKYEIAYN